MTDSISEILSLEVTKPEDALARKLALMARKHAIQILEAVAVAPDGLRFKDFVILVGGNPSVADHTLQALVRAGWLSRSGRYRLTTEGQSWLLYYHRNPIMRQAQQ